MDTSPILGGKFNFNLPLFITDLKKNQKKKNKKNAEDQEAPSNTGNKIDLIDIRRILHQRTLKHMFFFKYT